MRACLEVDIQALSKNIKTLLDLSGHDCFFCPMIKSDAYGHGALTVAKTLQLAEVKKLGVVSVEEALQLKDFSTEMEIYIFGPFEKTQIDIITSYSFIPVVGQWEDLNNLSSLIKKETPIHIKFNLGMNRLGFQISEVSALIDYIKYSPFLKLTGICSHLSEGEAAGLGEKHSTTQQINVFKNICYRFKEAFSDQVLHYHLLNSASAWALWSHSIMDSTLGFRPGISLYGIKTPVIFNSEKAKIKYHSRELNNVSHLKSFIVQSRTVTANQSVSYGQTWKSKKKSELAVVSMGYADGLPYKLSNKSEVLFRGKRVPIVGRICMDFFMIDVTEIWEGKEIQRGEEVVIFGLQHDDFISVQEQAEKINSIPYEFLTGLGSRVKKIYINNKMK